MSAQRLSSVLALGAYGRPNFPRQWYDWEALFFIPKFDSFLGQNGLESGYI